MLRYDWNSRYHIESRPCPYIVYNKHTGRHIFHGKADDAYDRLVQCAHPYYIDSSSRTFRDREAEKIANGGIR